MKLEAGDLILTGTPKGVGPVVPGETITVGLESEGSELSKLRFPVIERSGSFVYTAP
jgi:acylpyruvate hydrolase